MGLPSSHHRTTKLLFIRYLFLLTTLEGVASLFFLLIQPKSASNAWLLGYSPHRVAMILGLLFVNLVLIWLTVGLFLKPAWEPKFHTLLKYLLARDRLMNLVIIALSAGLIVAVFLLVLWRFTTDTYYQAYLLRFGPILIFGTLVIVQLLVTILSQVSTRTRSAWLWSLLFAGMLTLLEEWMLFSFHQLNEIALIFTILITILYSQVLFQRSFRMPRKSQLGWIIAVIMVGTFLCMQLFFIPKKYLLYSPNFFIFTPMILLGLLVITQLIEKILSSISGKIWGRTLIYLVILAGFIYLGNFYQLAGRAHSEQVNTTYAPYDDEGSYLYFAIKARLSNFRFTGTRNQMPVYPYIQALFYDPDISWDEFFVRGKQINIILSLIALVVLFLAFQAILPRYQAANLILITAFGLYVFKSGYFLVELLYYSLGALAYLLMSLALVKTSIKLSLGIGIVLGIAHLTKASVLPALLIFIGIFVINELFTAFLQKRNESLNTDNNQQGLKFRLTTLLLAVICYLAVIAPYIIESNKIYGSYFYNVNSTFYMWYDSWEEATEGTIAHGDNRGWPDMPPEDIPSPGKYFREHNISDVMTRIKYGIYWQKHNIRYQYSFFNYPILFLLFVSVLLFIDIKRSLLIAKKYFPLIVFATSYFIVYLGLYIWYSPIANSPRFIYALYVPLLLSIYVVAKALASKISLPLIKLTNLTVFGMILIDVWYIISQGPFNRNFGN